MKMANAIAGISTRPAKACFWLKEEKEKQQKNEKEKKKKIINQKTFFRTGVGISFLYRLIDCAVLQFTFT